VNDSKTPATCESILRRLDDYIDRELSPSDLQMVEQHIEECLRCAGAYRFEINLNQAVRSRLRRIRIPEDVMARIRWRLEADAAG
jgi:anti-sigma factor (TIGR02949 family)